jgi:antitoxin component YwqK of YwqJK toxin-antitoxin module
MAMRYKLLAIICLTVFSYQSGFSQENNYVAGKKDGVWNYYGTNKVLLARHFYKNGERTDIWEFYTISGTLSWTYNFKTSSANYLIENTADGYYAYQNGDSSWTKKQPSKKNIWLASESQWNDFLVKNLKYPEAAVQTRTQGKVEIRVYLDDHGNAVKYELGNNLDPLLNKEAMRVTKSFNPEFVPAVNNGTNVSSIYTLKVSFKLADSR